MEEGKQEDYIDGYSGHLDMLQDERVRRHSQFDRQLQERQELDSYDGEEDDESNAGSSFSG